MVKSISIALNVVFSVVLGILVALLVQARTEDVVRLTLNSDQVYGYQVAPTARQLEQLTGKEAYLVRLNGSNELNATRWQLRLDKQSQRLPPEG